MAADPQTKGSSSGKVTQPSTTHRSRQARRVRKESPWYDRNWLVLVSLFALWPVGLYGLWKSSHFSIRTKSFLTPFVALLVFGVLSGKLLTRDPIEMGDRLWEAGRHAEDITTYKKAVGPTTDISNNPRAGVTRAGQRILEYESTKLASKNFEVTSVANKAIATYKHCLGYAFNISHRCALNTIAADVVKTMEYALNNPVLRKQDEIILHYSCVKINIYGDRRETDVAVFKIPLSKWRGYPVKIRSDQWALQPILYSEFKEFMEYGLEREIKSQLGANHQPRTKIEKGKFQS